MNDTFDELLKNAINCKIDHEILNHSSDLEKNYTEIDIPKADLNILSSKLLTLSGKSIFVLFSKYCFHLTPNEVEVFFNIENAEGYVFHYRKMLSHFSGCKDNRILSDLSMETVCNIALKHYMDEEFYVNHYKIIPFHSKIKSTIQGLTKTVAVAACVFILTFSVSMAVNAEFREKVVTWVVETFEKFSIFQLKNDTDQTIEELRKYIPTYVPSRFQLVETVNQQTLTLYEYMSEDSERMAVFMSLSNNKTYVDTEGVSIEEIKLYDGTAHYFVKDGIQTLVFEKDGYSFIVYGSLTKSELLEIAENIQKK